VIRAQIISKGTDAEVAAAAARHGLAVNLWPSQPTQGPQRKGLAYVSDPDDDFLHGRLAKWFREGGDTAPFPAGTLLYFRVSVPDVHNHGSGEVLALCPVCDEDLILELMVLASLRLEFENRARASE
jgi:hypothetical protein